MDINNDTGTLANVSVLTSNTGIVTVSGTGALVLPVGNLAQQPTPSVGMVRYDSATSKMELYNGAWANVAIEGSDIDTLASLTDVSLTTPTVWQKLTYNGTKWINTGDEVDYVNVLTSWTSVGAGLYSADVRHQLGTSDLNVTLWNNAISTVVRADSMTLTDGTLATITIAGNTSSIKCVFTGGGMDQKATTLNSWTLVSGNLYSATFNHNLNTQDIIVTLWDTVTNKLIQADSIVRVDSNNIKVTITGNTASIRCVIDTGDIGIITGTWTASDSKYATNIAHALGSTGLIVSLWNTATGASVIVDAITIVDGNNVSLTASNNTTTIRCVIKSSGGIVTGSSGGTASNVLKAFSYYATSLDSPNNSDWAVNAMASTVFDPLNGALTVRQFLNTSETGVGFTSSVPLTASYVTLTIKGRTTTAPTAPAVNVVHNLYTRLIPNNAAVSAWTSPFALNAIVVPTSNTYYQYFTQTILLTSLVLIAGDLYQFELTRSSTNPNILPYNWYVAEVTLTFT